MSVCLLDSVSLPDAPQRWPLLLTILFFFFRLWDLLEFSFFFSLSGLFFICWAALDLTSPVTRGLIIRLRHHDDRHRVAATNPALPYTQAHHRQVFCSPVFPEAFYFLLSRAFLFCFVLLLYYCWVCARTQCVRLGRHYYRAQLHASHTHSLDSFYAWASIWVEPLFLDEKKKIRGQIRGISYRQSERVGEMEPTKICVFRWWGCG